LVAVAAHELLNAASGVNDLLVSGEERVAERGNFNVYDIALNAVYNAGFVCFDGRNASPLMIAINVQNWVAIRMCALLHENLSCAFVMTYKTGSSQDSASYYGTVGKEISIPCD
jgi:hypothetical protein